MLRALRTLVLTAVYVVGIVAFAPLTTLAATGDFCQAPGMVPGHVNSSGQCVPDDIPVGQACGSNMHYDENHNCVPDASYSGQSCAPGYHADSSGNCIVDASYGGQSCAPGYHADSSGNCIVDASYGGQTCAPGYTADSSGNCVADASAGTGSGAGASTPPPTSGGSGGGVQQSPLGGGRFTPSQSIQIDVAGIKRISDSVIGVINGIVVPLLFAVAFLVFVYGVSKYFIIEGDSDAKRETGRKFVLWSVIAFAVILSVWGLVNLVLNTFSLAPGGTPPAYPTL